MARTRSRSGSFSCEIAITELTVRRRSRLQGNEAPVWPRCNMPCNDVFPLLPLHALRTTENPRPYKDPISWIRSTAHFFLQATTVRSSRKYTLGIVRRYVYLTHTSITIQFCLPSHWRSITWITSSKRLMPDCALRQASNMNSYL